MTTHILLNHLPQFTEQSPTVVYFLKQPLIHIFIYDLGENETSLMEAVWKVYKSEII